MDIKMRLASALPAFSDELVKLLREANELALADQIPDLEIVEKCRCNDDFCSSIYTAPKPSGKWESPHRNVELDPLKGMLILDVVKERISHIEILFRDDVRSALNSIHKYD
jgi:hypothetical protein